MVERSAGQARLLAAQGGNILSTQEVGLGSISEFKLVAGKAWIAGFARSTVAYDGPQKRVNLSGQNVEVTVDSVDDPVFKSCKKTLETAATASGGSDANHLIILKGRARNTTFPPPSAFGMYPYDTGPMLGIYEFESLEKCELAPNNYDPAKAK